MGSESGVLVRVGVGIGAGIERTGLLEKLGKLRVVIRFGILVKLFVFFVADVVLVIARVVARVVGKGGVAARGKFVGNELEGEIKVVFEIAEVRVTDVFGMIHCLFSRPTQSGIWMGCRG